ncbi:MAG: 2-keto-4-pentenoate hydratase [Pseudomonadota bacterium]
MPSQNERASHREPLPAAHDLISQRLVEARLRAMPLSQFPGELPGTLREAYALQSASIERWPDNVAGWKVGGIPPEHRDTLLADRLSGPIYASTVVPIGIGENRTMPIYEGGFAAVEAEFVFRLGTTILPNRHEYSDQALINMTALHIGAEIASSPMADINRIGPVCVVCDFGNNGGLLVGPAIENWHELPLSSMTAAVSVDGALVGTANAADVEGGLLQPLKFLIALCAERGLTLTEGTYVSCGALTGIHDVSVESSARVDFGQQGSFDVTFEARKPLLDSSRLDH